MLFLRPIVHYTSNGNRRSDMNRRTFIATTSAVLLAGCSSDGDNTGSTTTGTEQSTTTQNSGEMTGTTQTDTTTGDATTGETTADETTDETTTSDSSTTTGETRTVAFGESASVSDGLDVAVTEADASDSYDHGGTTAESSDGNTFLLVTFETTNTAQEAKSLPEGAMASVQANGEQYDVAEAAAENWQQFVSSSVNSGGSATTTVAFEVPEAVVSSFGTSVQLSYTDSGAEQVVRWNME